MRRKHEHLELLVREQRVALRQHLASALKDALAVGLRIQGTYLTGSAGHPHRLESPAGHLVRRSLKRAHSSKPHRARRSLGSLSDLNVNERFMTTGSVHERGHPRHKSSK